MCHFHNIIKFEELPHILNIADYLHLHKANQEYIMYLWAPQLVLQRHLLKDTINVLNIYRPLLN